MYKLGTDEVCFVLCIHAYDFICSLAFAWSFFKIRTVKS